MKKIGFVLGIFLFVVILSWSYSLEGQSGLTPDMVKVLAVAALMACWWVSEAIPIPATSIIPLAAFPLLDVMGTKEIGPAYGDRMVLLLMGGFFIATVIEKVNLHKRIALNVIYRVGTNPRQLLLGFMIATAALSMWISNTATTLMMLPIALAVVTQLEKKFDNTTLAAAFLLSIAYSASIGGVGTPIGTPPNLIMMQRYEKTRRDFMELNANNSLKDAKQFLQELRASESPIMAKLRANLSLETRDQLQKAQDDEILPAILTAVNEILKTKLLDEERVSFDDTQVKDILFSNRVLLESNYPDLIRPHRRVKEISFASWMAVGIPTVIVLLFIMWGYMIFMFRLPKGSDDGSREILQKEIHDLGKMSRDEKSTAILFLITSLLWIFRKNIDLGFMVIPGWASTLNLPKCDDTTVAILMALVMFSFPMQAGGKLLDWPTAKKIPWGMLLLFGGGIALARAFDHTGLSQWLGEGLQHIARFPTIAVMLILCTFMTFLTEVTSNTAVTNVMMPILGITAVSIDANPALLMMPAAISASFAFMLPVATAPNAIMYGSDRFSIATMAKTGFMLNIIGIFIVTTMCYLLGQIFIFQVLSMDILYGIIKETWAITVEMSPYLLFGFLCAGILHSISSKKHILRHLSKPSFGSVVKSALVGVPLPLCSCAVIPVASHLQEEGASPGATISFLTSTPNTGVDSITVTYGMLGPVWAIVRPITAMFSGIFSGVVTNFFSRENPVVVHEDVSPQRENTQTWRQKLTGILRYAFFDIIRDIGKWLVVGIVIGGIIAFALPPSFMDKYLHSPMVSYFAMIVIGLPMYVCSTGSIPIAVALIGKGLSPGAALIFLITGPATNSATISYVWGKMGKKVLIAYLTSIIVTAILFGFMFDYFYPHINTATHIHHHGEESSLFAMICAIFLIVLFVNAHLPRRKKTTSCCKKNK